MSIHLSKTAAFAASLAAAALVVAGCSATTSSSPASAGPTDLPASSAPASPAEPAPSVSAATAGSYITWADYQQNPAAYSGNHVVLFFNASWCPTCQRTVDSLDESKGSFPAALTVVSVDYDASAALKQKYGVTTQHTFVEISPEGEQIKKWSGSESADAINAKVSSKA